MTSYTSGVGVAQLVEHWTVAPVVAGSNPVAHPQKIKYLYGFIVLDFFRVHLVSEIVPGKVGFRLHHALRISYSFTIR